MAEPKVKKEESVIYGRKVSRISLHQPTNICGDVKATLSAKQKNLDIVTTPIGLLVTGELIRDKGVSSRVISYNNAYEWDFAD